MGVLCCLLSWFGSTCPLRWTGHCKSVPTGFLYATVKHFSPGFYQAARTSIHRKRGVTEWFAEYENGVVHRLWPPSQSPDLNPVEPLSDVLKQQVHSLAAPPPSRQDLQDLLPLSRCQITQGTFRGLVESMP